jgi:hypothetical protein
MKNVILPMFATTILVIGCGGGIDGSTKLSDLSQADTDDLCDELVDDYPEKTVDCGSGVMITVGFTASDCSDNAPPPATCAATVDDVRNCTSALYEGSNACSDNLPAACARLADASCN